MHRPVLHSSLFAVAIAATAVIGFTVGRSRQVAPSTPPREEAAAPDPDRLHLSPQARSDSGLTVAPVTHVELADTLDATAVLALDETRTARIGSMVDGIVIRTLVEVGDRVKTGTLLAELHSHLVHDAWAGYRRALAERRRLETELAYAKDAEARAARLLESKAISLQERERATANRMAAEEMLDMARTEIRRSEEELEHLGITNGEDPTGESGEQIPSRSPMAGVVLERLVTPGTAVTPGTPLFIVSDLGALWAIAELDERLLGRVSVGDPLTIRVSAFGDRAFPGTVDFVADAVNPTTRRVVVRCRIANADGGLKPGMFATARFATGQTRTAVAVPLGSVQEVGGERVVFVEEQDGTFVRRTVTVGTKSDEWTEIVSGLRAGERVASDGAFLLKSQLLNASAPSEE